MTRRPAVGTAPARTGWRDTLLRFMLHVATGVLAVLVHYGVMALAMHLGAPPVAASALGFVGGALTRLYTAYFHVFSPTRSLRAVAPRFALALAAQFAANAGLLALLLALGLPVWWAQGLTTAALALATFLVYRLLVFN